MKLYGRLLSTLATSPYKSKVKPLDTVITRWTVLPNDLDLFGHMNNGRYAMIMDIARVDFIARLDMLGSLFKKRWMVPVGNTQFDFKKSLKPFSKYEIHTRLCYWDDTWFYFKQDFILANEPKQLAAEGYVKVIFKGPKGIIASKTVIDEVMSKQTGHIERPILSAQLAQKFNLTLPFQKPPAEIHQSPANASPNMPDKQPSEHASDAPEPIAIVGIGCRFPGGVENPEDLWKVLVDGKDCVVDIPSERWDPKKFYDPSGQSPGRAYVNKGGMLSQNIYEFDPSFFGIAPREAEILDPMQRLLLEVSWEAFEDAGINPKTLSGRQVAVFIGGFVVDSMIQQYSPLNRSMLGAQSATASSLTLLSNRLSYFYDLRGPSLSLDTACSSSLVAVHQACRSIWSGESESALVGGVNMLLAPETQITMCKGKFLSPNGRCNTFGAGADGYVRGEGAALVLLKPLSKALEDGNQIYSLIRGTAANQDGRTNGITVPNGEAQQAALRSALSMSKLDASQINYMEAHGTGTPVGDPIEAHALGSVLGESRRQEQACPVGSLKTNVGHMEASAGIGGLIKAALVLKHRMLVPHLHLEEVNPNIDFSALKLRVPQHLEALPAKGPLFAGVNSFGYGGTNAHVILESPPEPANDFFLPAKHQHALALPISAASENALSKLAAKLHDIVTQPNTDIRRLASALATQRSHLSSRAWVSGKTTADILAGLKALSEKTTAKTLQTSSQANPKVIFVYTGMGPQWWAMGRELYAEEPVFKEALDACEEIFKTLSGWSLLDEILADEKNSRIRETQIAQPANLAIQVGLSSLLRSWGIQAQGIVGHSIGEVAAAWASGALSLDTAFLVAYQRSRLQAKTAGKGAMLAVGLSADKALERIQSCADKVSIAAINSPSAVTLAGDTAALENLAEALEAEHVFHQFLKVEVPYHSPVMNEIEQELKSALAEIETQKAHTPLYSTVSGHIMNDAHDADYWWRNVRESVSFAKAIEQSLADGFNIFVEIGPHPVLASSILETAKAASKHLTLVSTLVRKDKESEAIQRSIGKLYCHGVDLDWSAYFGVSSHQTLPSYPWQRSVFRYEGERARRYRLPHDGHPMVARTTLSPMPVWHVELNAFALPYVQDHQVSGSILFPGSGFVELGLTMANDYFAKRDENLTAISLENIEFLSPAIVRNDESGGLMSLCDESEQAFKILYKSGESQPELCAQGQFFSGSLPSQKTSLSEVASRFDANLAKVSSLSPNELYPLLAGKGLVYGPSFQAVSHIRIKAGETLATIRLPDTVDATGYLLHPVLLDAALHSLIAGSEQLSGEYSVIPMGIDSFHWFGLASDELTAHGRLAQHSATVLKGDIDLYDQHGFIMAKLRGLHCRILAKPRVDLLTKTNQWVYKKTWQAMQNSANPKPQDWLVIDQQIDAQLLRVQLWSQSQESALWTQAWSHTELIRFLNEQSQKPSPLAIIDTRFQSLNDGDDAELMTLALRSAEYLLETLQSISSYSLNHYALITYQLEQVLETDTPQLACALLEGLARTAMTEYPKLQLRLVDVDQANMSIPSLIHQLSGLGNEQEVAIRATQTYAMRIDRHELSPRQKTQALVSAEQVPAYELAQQEVGKIESLRYLEKDLPQPKADEVVVEMVCSSLHFKDLMKVLGILSSDAKNNTYYQNIIGMEGTGIISAVGSGVTHLKQGDPVFVWGAVMQSHLCVPKHSVAKLPKEIELLQGANLVTYFTVYHSFFEMAHLKKGETVLIHSATGGVGLAAINLAKWAGATIIATAGSEEKRAYLRSLGISQVSDSRNLSFVDDVMRWTQGQGVDVVLNFTPGEVMHKSIDCLAPYGRFIELGKQSFDRNEALRLKPFMENLSYISVDIDRLTKQRPAYMDSIVERIFELLASGEIPPLPCEFYNVGDTTDAFRTMARGNYTGKLAIVHQRKGLMVKPKQTETLFQQEASYVITGGLGGFGLQVAEWMSVKGAGHLVLLSRSGPKSEEAQQAIERMQARGTGVTALSLDVSDNEKLSSTFKLLDTQIPPIKGFMHAAMVLDDKMLPDIDSDSLSKVVRAKAQGAWNLHRLSKHYHLDFMILFSSISSLIGNAGQANYVAANNFLDQLAHYRQARDLPCLSINWGVFEETGVVARNEHLAKHLRHIGIEAFSSEDATNALAFALTEPSPQVGVMDVDWSRFANLLQEGAGKQRFDLLAAADSDQGAGGNNASLQQSLFEGKTLEERGMIIQTALMQAVAHVMRLDLEKIAPSDSLRDLGLDSLMAVEIDVEFSSLTGLDIPSADISSGPTIEALEKRLLKRLNEGLALPASETLS